MKVKIGWECWDGEWLPMKIWKSEYATDRTFLMEAHKNQIEAKVTEIEIECE